jgi:hypothetical protein
MKDSKRYRMADRNSLVLKFVKQGIAGFCNVPVFLPI